MKNLKVSKKIWLLLIVVVVPMLVTGLWLTQHLLSIEENVRNTVQELEQRHALVKELRGDVEITAGHLLAANLVSDPASKPFFEKRFREAAANASELLQVMEKKITTEAGRAIFREALQERQSLYASIERVQRSDEGADLLYAVQNYLIPAVDKYQKALDKLGQWQEKLVQESLQTGQAQRTQGMAVGAAVLVSVLLLGLLMARWLVKQLTQPLEQAVVLANHIARGDLTHTVHDDRTDEMGQLLQSLGAMSNQLRDVVSQVRGGVDAVSAAASEIATGGQDLSTRTEQSAANLEETAASIEELTATVTQSAETARQANQLALTAEQAAQRGGDVVAQVVQSMEHINTSSRKINDIIGVIDGIAFQTNILALNAAVEAARAGEQGRGFAVVAGEVRNLAQRSAEAAKEVKALITTSVSNVDTGALQVAQAGESMQAIVHSVRRVNDLIAEITASANEQRDGIAQVNQAISNLDQMTQQNAALVEESSAAATAMHEQAQRLTQVVSVFNVGQAAVQSAPVLAVTPSAIGKSYAPAAVAGTVQTPRNSAVAMTKPLSVPPAQLATSSKVSAARVQPLAPSSEEKDWETF